jgi:hypothetical protein
MANGGFLKRVLSKEAEDYGKAWKDDQVKAMKLEQASVC